MTRVYEKLCRSHDDDGNDNPEWHALRRTGVTATDAAHLMTGGSWFELWARKTGRTEREYERNERMQWGHWMQPVILKAYSSDMYANREVEESDYLIRSTEFPWVLATLDAVTNHPEHGWIPLDAKNTDKFLEWKWEEGPPEPYAWQIRHQAIAAGDAPASSIACALGGNRLIWADDEQTVTNRELLLSITERFWWHVKNDAAPTQMDGSKRERDALNAMFVPDASKTVKLGLEFRELDYEYNSILNQLDEASSVIAPLEKRKKEIENRFRLAMGEASIADVESATWKLSRVDGKSYTVDRKPYNRITRKANR